MCQHQTAQTYLQVILIHPLLWTSTGLKDLSVNFYDSLQIKPFYDSTINKSAVLAFIQRGHYALLTWLIYAQVNHAQAGHVWAWQ